MTVVDVEAVFEIAEAVFAAMIDGDHGLLVVRDDQAPVDDPVVAWVDICGPYPGRTAVTTSTATASALVRALLDVGADAGVTDDDRTDAFGEIANVVGGNIKALLPEQGSLGLPRVATAVPPTVDPLVLTLRLAWRGEPLDISVWLTQHEGGAR
ncbi:MAG: chemotaxis protein CheX [Micrococcales bacterium]|nr:chemotaxis protein CheX [Micrococcales bacterium]